MNTFMDLLIIFIGAAIVNNFVLTRFLGLCTFFGVSRKLEPSIGFGLAVIFVLGCSSALCWVLYEYVMKPYNLMFLKNIIFILIIAAFVQLVEAVVRKMNPALFKYLGVYLILMASNCAVLAPPLINIDKDYNFFQSVVQAVGSGAGFALALILMSCIRERLEFSEVPESMRGMPISFIVAGLLALAFMGFTAMIKL
ncbi:MAG: RnfABCDGE type electron transport complex subunit A [Firmicutes bacterium]|nr:RnfABCDGE type electron transport complex subunit A [Bacillota bacterium]